MKPDLATEKEVNDKPDVKDASTQLERKVEMKADPVARGAVKENLEPKGSFTGEGRKGSSISSSTAVSDSSEPLLWHLEKEHGKL